MGKTTDPDTDTVVDDNIDILVPTPDRVVTYATSSSEPTNGALFLFGDPNSEKIALLCAGFADDHTVFQPFAKALSISGVFVGVMCLPGYDDRPEDDVPWTKHKADGYSYDEMTNAIRDAAKVLRKESTYNNKNKNANPPKFTAIFHDWAVTPGTMWAKRLVKEFEEEQKAISSSSSSSSNINIFKPDKIVFFDVLMGPSPDSKDIPKDIPPPSKKETICSIMYQVVLAGSFLVQRDISKHLAAAMFIFGLTILELFKLGPLYAFDIKSVEPLYKNESKSLFRVIYMAYPYWNILGKNALYTTNDDFKLHEDWKVTPILYLYGTKKKAQFHDYTTLKMLEREEKEKRSLSKAIAVEDAGHYLYVQKQAECLKAVIEFMDAENTFIVEKK